MSLPEMNLRILISRAVGMKKGLKIILAVFALLASSVVVMAQKVDLPYVDGESLT